MRPRRSAVAALTLLTVAAIAKLPTLGQPLTENFAWRQTQTAWTARIFHEQGIDLFHPEVPVHGPPWHFGFEFPLFQAGGALLMDLGIEPDVAMRTLGLIAFLVSGWLAYRLATRLAGIVAGLGTLAAFLFSPFGLLWGRTSLIEYLATAAALGFLLAAIRWLDERRPADFALAMVAGVVAMLVKITTGAFYLLPLFFYRPRGTTRRMPEAATVLLVSIPMLVGLAWTRYIDALKASSPATAFQTTANMIDFNFGSPSMRLDPEALFPIFSALMVGLAGAGLVVWLPASFARAARLRQGPFLGALALSALIGAPLVLTPLYSTQNYYPAAMSPVVALLVGLGISWAWTRPDVLGRLALVAGAALWVLALLLTGSYWMMSYERVVDRDGSLAAAKFIRERTDPEDWVVIGGRGWDPTILYYADRRGYMLDSRRRPADDLAKLRADPRYTLFVNCAYEAPCQLMPGG